MPKCICCGDIATKMVETRSAIPSHRADFVYDRDLRQYGVPYCTECFEEIYHNKISSEPAKLDSCGLGCPLDSNNPSQENAIRILEGD